MKLPRLIEKLPDFALKRYTRLRAEVSKIPMYNAVSTLHGYKEIDIFSPLEVIYYEEE